MQLQHIPLERIKISRVNMRHSRKHPDVSDILPSIRKRGIAQPILVRKEGKGFGVVAGRRRWFALKRIAKEEGGTIKVPCAIMEAGDDAAALEASIIENVGRLPASEMEQYEAFGRLAGQGRNVNQIAGYFGVTELKVKRILALANLLDEIRALYVKGDVNRDTIRALTLASKEQQTKWLRMHQSEDEQTPMGRNLKIWLGGGAAIAVNVALFDPAEYEGGILEDLFGECGQFENAALFWEAQNKAIAARAAQYQEQGWQGVILLERGDYFCRWEHVERARDEGGNVFVAIRHSGEVEFHAGYITRSEARKLDKIKQGEEETPAETKPEMSGPMAEYIALHRHGAAGASLLEHPDIALRLTVAHMIAGSSLWQVRAHRSHSRKETTRQSVEASRAHGKIEKAGTEIAELFVAHDVKMDGSGKSFGEVHLCELFAALLKMTDAQVMQVLTFVMADTLAAGGPVVEAVAHLTETDIGKYWQADDAFFVLLRDKRAINAMVGDIAGKACAGSVLTETAKSQQQIIRNRIVGQGCKAVPDWRPAWMNVPPTSLVSGAKSLPADAWQQVQHLFGSVEQKAPEEKQAVQNPPQSV
jgi:ParB family chromosome partitioning protein